METQEETAVYIYTHIYGEPGVNSCLYIPSSIWRTRRKQLFIYTLIYMENQEEKAGENFVFVVVFAIDVVLLLLTIYKMKMDFSWHVYE